MKQKISVPATARPPIASYLRRGEANAISAARLARMSGCRSTRELRLRVSAERADTVILSSSRGYFLPGEGAAGRAEVERFREQMRSRAQTSFRMCKAANRVLKQLEGQTALEGFNDGRQKG